MCSKKSRFSYFSSTLHYYINRQSHCLRPYDNAKRNAMSYYHTFENLIKLTLCPADCFGCSSLLIDLKEIVLKKNSLIVKGKIVLLCKLATKLLLIIKMLPVLVPITSNLFINHHFQQLILTSLLQTLLRTL
jgi:hypothetical protein